MMFFSEEAVIVFLNPEKVKNPGDPETSSG